eukprot:scaffold1325_cov138-Amphora_coffeaeformis.AAC.4
MKTEVVGTTTVEELDGCKGYNDIMNPGAISGQRHINCFDGTGAVSSQPQGHGCLLPQNPTFPPTNNRTDFQRYPGGTPMQQDGVVAMGGEPRNQLPRSHEHEQQKLCSQEGQDWTFPDAHTKRKTTNTTNICGAKRQKEGGEKVTTCKGEEIKGRYPNDSLHYICGKFQGEERPLNNGKFVEAINEQVNLSLNNGVKAVGVRHVAKQAIKKLRQGVTVCIWAVPQGTPGNNPVNMSSWEGTTFELIFISEKNDKNEVQLNPRTKKKFVQNIVQTRIDAIRTQRSNNHGGTYNASQPIQVEQNKHIQIKPNFDLDESSKISEILKSWEMDTPFVVSLSSQLHVELKSQPNSSLARTFADSWHLTTNSTRRRVGIYINLGAKVTGVADIATFKKACFLPEGWRTNESFTKRINGILLVTHDSDFFDADLGTIKNYTVAWNLEEQGHPWYECTPEDQLPQPRAFQELYQDHDDWKRRAGECLREKNSVVLIHPDQPEALKGVALDLVKEWKLGGGPQDRRWACWLDASGEVKIREDYICAIAKIAQVEKWVNEIGNFLDLPLKVISSGLMSLLKTLARQPNPWKWTIVYADASSDTFSELFFPAETKWWNASGCQYMVTSSKEAPADGAQPFPHGLTPLDLPQTLWVEDVIAGFD